MARSSDKDTGTVGLGTVFQVLTVLYMFFIYYLSNQPNLPQPGPFKDVPSFDKYEHMFEFFILGILMFMSFRYSRSRRLQRWAWTLTLAGALAYALFDEIHQYFVNGRVFDLIDLTADGTGIFIAGFLGVWSSQRTSPKVVRAIPMTRDMLDSEE